MTEKILFLHIGATKTGSSMLQNFFEFNYIQLEKSGFAYENRLNIKSQFEVSSGNDIQLYDALTLISSTEDEIDNLVSSYFGQYDKAIC